MLYFFIGLAGSGKTYVAKLFAKEYGYHFEDADQWLTQEMQEAIQNAQAFTQEMRNQYFEIIIGKIKILQKEHPNLVIAQACYKEKNRQQLYEAFPDIQLILIEATKEILIQRLVARKSEATLEYANQIIQEFEMPNKSVRRINNDVDGDNPYLINQVKNLLNILPSENTSKQITDQVEISSIIKFGSPVFRPFSNVESKIENASHTWTKLRN